MSDIRVDEAGVPWQPCPLCRQLVIPSHNGWARHAPWCPGKDGPSVPIDCPDFPEGSVLRHHVDGSHTIEETP